MIEFRGIAQRGHDLEHVGIVAQRGLQGLGLGQVRGDVFGQFGMRALGFQSRAFELFGHDPAVLDLLLDASLHGFLPLANVALPLVLTLVFLGVPGSRRPLAGVALGTAAYLASVIVLGNVYSPVGSAVLTAWCAVNALACMLLARLVLARTVS